MTYRDHFTELFELKERAEEDIFFARRDRELIERLRQMNAEQRRLHCPECGRPLQQQSINGMNLKACSACHGAWIAEDRLATSAKEKHDNWARNFLSGLMHLVEHPYG